MSAILPGVTLLGTKHAVAALLLSGVLMLSALDVSVAQAGHAHGGQPQGQSRALSPQVYQQLTQVRDLMEQSQYAAAEKILHGLLPQLAARGYEKAIGLQTLAHVQASRNRYPEAAQSLQESVALGMLPEDVQQQARYDLAQLYLASDAPGEAVAVLETWFEHADQPPAAAHFLLGAAYVQLKQYRKAIVPLQRALEASQTADETWYQTLLAAHYELASYTGCAEVLEAMVRLFPNRDYWQQLAGIYLTLKRDERALATLELAYRQQRLKREQDLLQLAQLYLAQDIPFKAAQLLETEMGRARVEADAHNLELLGSAWAAARERAKAVAAYQRAMRAGADGGIGLYVAQLYIEDERWQDAAAVLESTLKHGGLIEPGDAWLLLGVARYETGAFDAARSAFDEAARHQDARSAAEEWLAHLQKKL